MRFKALDLFSCCGGAGRGIHDAGFEVVGVDVTNNHEYTYKFIHSDVFDLERKFFDEFDFVWSSPPCQCYTWSTRKGREEKFPDLIDKTRKLLTEIGKPFVIENVVGAPLRKDLVLCGEMFKLRVLRHRIFEIHNFIVPKLKHVKHKPPIDKGHSWYACVSGHGGDSYSFKFSDWCDAIDLYHIHNREHLAQAVPPAYSRYIANFVMRSPDSILAIKSARAR